MNFSPLLHYFLVVGVSHLMTLIGLSPALGAFLAGVMLANSEFRHELESNINPFRGSYSLYSLSVLDPLLTSMLLKMIHCSYFLWLLSY